MTYRTFKLYCLRGVIRCSYPAQASYVKLAVSKRYATVEWHPYSLSLTVSTPSSVLRTGFNRSGTFFSGRRWVWPKPLHKMLTGLNK
jgi:hypothetical protein